MTTTTAKTARQKMRECYDESSAHFQFAAMLTEAGFFDLAESRLKQAAACGAIGDIFSACFSELQEA